MDDIVAKLAEKGLAGLFIAYLIWKNYQLEKRLDDQQTRSEAVQEKRAEEREKNAAVLAAHSEAQRDLAAAVQSNSTLIASFVEKATILLAQLDGGRGR